MRHSSPIGATTEVIALAHDLYTLKKDNCLRESLVQRLRNCNEFEALGTRSQLLAHSSNADSSSSGWKIAPARALIYIP